MIIRASFLIALLILCGACAESERPSDWNRSVYDIMENGGSVWQVSKLLGEPSIKRTLVLSDHPSLLKRGAAYCLDPSKQAQQDAWFYPVEDGGYWIIFARGRSRCTLFEPKMVPVFVR